MRYDIVAFEYKEGTEEAETYCVLINGNDTNEVFGSYEEAQAWIEQNKNKNKDK